MRVIVAKIGGSLFDLPDLRQRLRAFLSTTTADRVLFVPGGGAGADVVRQFDRTHHLGEEKSHWLAIRVLTINAHFLARLLDIPVITNIDNLVEPYGALDPFEFCRADDCRPDSLPHHWDVTSDSIAARVAFVAGAELVLLKSTDLPEGLTWQEAAERSFVDKEFSTYAASIPVSWINLRQSSFAAIPGSP